MLKRLLAVMMLIYVVIAHRVWPELPAPFEFSPPHQASQAFHPEIEATLVRGQLGEPSDIYEEAWKTWPVDALYYLKSLADLVTGVHSNARAQVWSAISRAPFEEAGTLIEQEILRAASGKEGREGAPVWNLTNLYTTYRPAPAFAFLSRLAMDPMEQNLRMAGHDGMLNYMSSCGRTDDELRKAIETVDKCAHLFPGDEEVIRRDLAIEGGRAYLRAREPFEKSLMSSDAGEIWKTHLPIYLQGESPKVRERVAALSEEQRKSRRKELLEVFRRAKELHDIPSYSECCLEADLLHARPVGDEMLRLLRNVKYGQLSWELPAAMRALGHLTSPAILGELSRDPQVFPEVRRHAIAALAFDFPERRVKREWKRIKKALYAERGQQVPAQGLSHGERMLQTYDLVCGPFPGERFATRPEHCRSRIPSVAPDYLEGHIWPYTYFRRVGDEWLVVCIEVPAIP